MGSSDEVKAAAPTTEHDAEIEQLKAELHGPTELQRKQARLAELEAERAAKHLAQGKSVAERRLLGILRALGSVKDQLDQDAERYIAALAMRAKAAETFNARFEQSERLIAEHAALVDRFGIVAKVLEHATAPAVRKDVLDATAQHGFVGLAERTDAYAPQVESDATGLRQRRTFAEIAGTPGYEIIVDAGLVPFPELTERQREIVAERDGAVRSKATRAREQSDILANEAARIEAARGNRVGPTPRSGA